MKKLILFTALLVGGLHVSNAGIFDSDEDRVRTVTYQIDVASATGVGGTSTNTVVIDLSDTVNWKHTNTREINITGIKIEVDKLAASTGTVKLGVVNYIGVSTGSVSWFYHKSIEKNVSNTSNVDVVNYTDNPIKTRIEGGTAATDGTPVWLKTSDTTSGSTVFQTDVNLPSPNGNTSPGRGDIVLQINNRDFGNYIRVSLTLQYYTPSSD